jgi:hypothetical protein
VEPPNYISKLAYCEDSNLIIGATVRGRLYVFQPHNFCINSNYRREYETAPGLRRPIREFLEHELLKNQFSRARVSEM